MISDFMTFNTSKTLKEYTVTKNGNILTIKG